MWEDKERGKAVIFPRACVGFARPGLGVGGAALADVPLSLGRGRTAGYGLWATLAAGAIVLQSAKRMVSAGGAQRGESP